MQYLLTLKSIQHSITHLLRSIDGGSPAFQQAQTIYDAALLAVVRRLTPLTESLHPISISLAFTALRCGGLGLRRWADVADAAFVAS